jgi:hypothetical protein
MNAVRPSVVNVKQIFEIQNSSWLADSKAQLITDKVGPIA